MTETPQKKETLKADPKARTVEPDKKSNASESEGFLGALFWAAVIAIIVRSFLFEPFSIPSGSMFPTLKIGDYLFVQKYKYGYSQYSLPFGIIEFEGRILEKHPARGDIVVFRKPHQEHIDYIKRVIGLPGDTVKMTNGQLFINNEAVIKDFHGLEDVRDAPQFVTYKKYIESLPDGPDHYIYEISDNEPLDTTPNFVVPDGYFFAMGDNRDASLDSRAINSVGFIPIENLVGRAAFFFFSIEPIADTCTKTGTFKTIKKIGCMLVTIPKHIRYDRIMRPVHRDVDE